jgi:hypothetical protein
MLATGFQRERSTLPRLQDGMLRSMEDSSSGGTPARRFVTLLLTQGYAAMTRR